MTTTSHDEGRVHSPDGVSIYWQRWLPEEPRAVLLLVHGLGEHSGRYGNPVDYFAARGFGCYGLDYRGHGRSPGVRVHVDRFEQYHMDLGAVHGMVRKEHPELPIFLLGHSQGGLIVLTYAQSYPKEIPGVIASSPFLGIHESVRPGTVEKIAAPIASRLLPKLKFPNNVDATYLSHDPEVVKAYRDDPLVSDKVTARWFTSILEAHESVLAGAASLTVPTLVMQSGGDRLVDVESTRRFVERAPKKLVEYEQWEGFYHEMFNEPEADRRRVFERMETWLETRLSE